MVIGTWRREAVAWLDERLADTGLRRTGDVEHLHVRPWATAMRAPITGGPVWMKAAGPATGFEVGLYELLHRVGPGCEELAASPAAASIDHNDLHTDNVFAGPPPRTYD